MKIIKYIVDAERFNAIKLKGVIVCGLAILSVISLLGLIYIFGVGRYWWILIAAVGSFAIAFSLVSVMGILYALAWHWHMIRRHPDLWRRSFFQISIEQRVKASQEIRSMKDPFLEKISFLLNKMGLFVFKIWFMCLVLFLFFFFIYTVLQQNN